jgi:DNA polymerase-1
MPMARLLLLDGHSLAYRAFFALPVESFSTTTGQPTNAVYGFTSMLINLLRDEKPTHVCVAFDRAEPTFRHDAYPAYKATRSETPADFKGQVSLIREVLDALQVQTCDKAGFEADDVIATLATQASVIGMETLIATGDRDALQLVDEHVTVIMTRKGVSDLVRFTPDAVQEKYGLTPTQYPDFAALRGDPSDNLPNIPGVGEKTATKWIQEFGSLAALVDRADEVKGKVGESLRNHVAQVLQNRQLTELDRSVDVGCTVTDLESRQWDRDQVHEVFDALQFRVLRERLFATVETAQPEADHGFVVDAEPLDAAWLANHAQRGRTGLSVQGSWGRGTGTVHGLALAAADGATAYADPGQLGAADSAALADWLADPALPKAVHDGKGPLLALRAHGFALNGVTSDTALAAYLLQPGQRTFDLSDLAIRHLHRELRSDSAPPQLFDDGPVGQDTAIRARATADLADTFDPELQAKACTALLGDVELPLVAVLADMEQIGIAVDADHLAAMSASLGARVKQAEEQATQLVGHAVNLGSPKQLQVVLFDELGLPKTKKIKTGYTTDADALQWLALQRPEVEVLQVLLMHRDVTRLKSVVDGLLASVDEGGRIHTTYSQTVAATGRLSSTDPNLQNVPIRTADGREIRKAFRVGEGYECLLTADYSQIEMRIMAHLSRDEGLIAAFGEGEDLHTTVGSKVFEVDPADVTADMRRRVKAMSYGLAYGLSAFGLSAQLKISTEEARNQMEAYFTRFGGVRDYLATVVDQARTDGWTETVLGRRRYLPDLVSDNAQRRQMAERMALNAPIQGSAADIVKIAMLRVASGLQGMRSRMLLQVHDELVLEVAPGERDAVEELVRTEMAGAYPMDVALEVSVGFGQDWDAAAH